jgi:DNA-binding response OmpR family regulator
MSIVVVSAVTTTEKVAEALEAGANIFLGKPVSAKELRHVVASLISQHESGISSLSTKHLVATAPLQAVEPESRHDAVVAFVAGYSDAPITITVKQPVSFGRSADLPPKTYVDLSRFNAIDQGVSRVHMTLHNKDGRFLVEDNNSVNGTFLNGEPLKPHEPRAINNADEVRLGQLRVYIYFLTDKEKEASSHSS